MIINNLLGLYNVTYFFLDCLIHKRALCKNVFSPNGSAMIFTIMLDFDPNSCNGDAWVNKIAFKTDSFGGDI